MAAIELRLNDYVYLSTHLHRLGVVWATVIKLRLSDHVCLGKYLIDWGR